MVLLTNRINNELDSLGLKELTIGRTADGYIQLIGRKCGAMVMSFSAMPVGKKLTKEERTILANDYLIPSINGNSKLLKDLLVLKQDTVPQDVYDDFKEVQLVKHRRLLSAHRKHLYNDDKKDSIIYYVKNRDDDTTSTEVKYDTDDHTYTINYEQEAQHPAGAVNNMFSNAAKTELEDYIEVLEEWMTVSEELKAHLEAIEEIEGKLAIKCTL